MEENKFPASGWARLSQWCLLRVIAEWATLCVARRQRVSELNAVFKAHSASTQLLSEWVYDTNDIGNSAVDVLCRNSSSGSVRAVPTIRRLHSVSSRHNLRSCWHRLGSGLAAAAPHVTRAWWIFNHRHHHHHHHEIYFTQLQACGLQ